MPLTPEDVVNKRFNATRVREGYAQEEVDDFLDEVVEELRRLNAENDDLREKLRQSEARIAELDRTLEAASGDAGAGDGPTGGSEEVSGAEEPDAPSEPAPSQPAVQQGAPQQPAPGAGAVEQAAGMLALAQRLHDEYVHEAETQRDRIVSEARSAAERLVSEATEEREHTLGLLQSERMDLETAIDHLRSFEQESRARLGEYFQTQLDQLRRQAPVVSEGPAGDRS
ncbi:DivIVA domain-containing protein [Kineococcus xinjiangensis]|uniref:Cell wall synthesis protein Wag31 n=1 Tax=Kineococcus xinjiangensis TaxID=512762 RepID=A0A2S6ILX2_9ACTN|nr:DivIVA domain-containing protein [Kineococcus xinjiangensis]PPK95227.1 DivIVA domain-containing protein [Kineococcus xinjiangensis]